MYYNTLPILAEENFSLPAISHGEGIAGDLLPRDLLPTLQVLNPIKINSSIGVSEQEFMATIGQHALNIYYG